MVTDTPLCFTHLSRLVADAPRDHGANWLVDQIIHRGRLHLVTAPPAHGKSMVLMDLGRAVCRGEAWLDAHPACKGGVLWINGEMNTEDVADRSRRLNIAAADPFHILEGRSLNLASDDHVTQIVQYIGDHQVVLVIVDGLIRTHSLSETSASAMNHLFQNFRRLMDAGAAVVFATWDTKRGGSGSTRTRGSGDIVAQVDMAYAIDRIGESPILRLHTIKGRLVAADGRVPIDFLIEDNEDGGLRLRRATDEDRAAAAELPLRDRIVEYLREQQPATTDAILKGVKGGQNPKDRALKSLIEEGIVLLEVDGRRHQHMLAADISAEQPHVHDE
jgi:hypothetical protein